MAGLGAARVLRTRWARRWIRHPGSTPLYSSAASDVYKRQVDFSRELAVTADDGHERVGGGVVPERDGQLPVAGLCQFPLPVPLGGHVDKSHTGLRVSDLYGAGFLDDVLLRGGSLLGAGILLSRLGSTRTRLDHGRRGQLPHGSRVCDGENAQVGADSNGAGEDHCGDRACGDQSGAVFHSRLLSRAANPEACLGGPYRAAIQGTANEGVAFGKGPCFRANMYPCAYWL